jgi:hypothetical protein
LIVPPGSGSLAVALIINGPVIGEAGSTALTIGPKRPVKVFEQLKPPIM